MRLKYQLRGLGIGLIITTIILTISHNVREIEANSKSNIQPQESTGSILAFDKDAESSKADHENNTDAGSQSESETQPESETQTESQPQTEPQQSQTATQEERPAETTAQTGSVVTVNIKDVYYARQAADILYAAGVITDKADFVNYLDKAGYAERICEGTYQIKQGDSYENIAKTICRVR